MKYTTWLFVITLQFLLISCKSESSEVNVPDNSQEEPKQERKENTQEKTISKDESAGMSYEEKKISSFTPERFAKMIAERIVQRNFNDWGKFSSSLIFFSPYAHIKQEEMTYLGANYLQEHYESEEVFTWGVQDGTGDSIKMTFHDYIDRYVADFPLMGQDVTIEKVDQPHTRGNEMHNVNEIFPKSILVEIHKPSDDEMGMNWRSLILVLEKVDGRLRLQGMVHNEWTI